MTEARVAAARRRVAVDGVELDLGGYLARLDGRVLHLTLQEFRLLTVLLDRAGQVVGRRELLDRVWGNRYPDANRTLDVHILRLRRKLDRPGTPSRIRTVRSVGYVFDRR